MGIRRVIVNGTAPDDWPIVAELAQRFPDFVRPAYGVHPLYVERACDGWLTDLRRRLEADSTASIGEIGLDRSDAAGPIEIQKRIFELQWRLAVEMERPCTIHCRRAWDLLRPCLEAQAPFRRGFVLHSYGGGEGQVKPLAAIGAYFSFSGTLTWPRNHRGPAALLAVPADRVLAETDSPDLSPWCPECDGAAEPNEPANLLRVVHRIAELRGGSVTEWSVRLTDNARRCFEGC